MSEVKNCMVQYATKNEILHNTDLITQSEAIELFNSLKKSFKENLENEEDPELALWINCKHQGNYSETMHHWHASDFIVIDDKMYQLTEV